MPLKHLEHFPIRTGDIQRAVERYVKIERNVDAAEAKGRNAEIVAVDLDRA
ncbi:MAG TPA: hypothetical protein VMU87_16180 [Stellaceae bacterium]|nr:hypothetical protein [Stellaceae bacterium]